MIEVKRPTFIVGTGRCGSSIFYRVLSYHNQLSWLSQYCARKPHDPRANRHAMRALDLPLLSGFVRKLVYPSEAYRFWQYYYPGFSEPCRDLVKEDVTLKVSESVQGAIAQTLSRKRDRLLVKITGWPRIGFLKEIFPDARFIHVYRDGRAVVNSLLHVRWWSGWQGPSNWRWGKLTPAQMEKWERHGRSFVALAAIEWEILMLAQERAKGKIPSDDLLEIRYEDLCQQPVRTFKKAVEFSRVEWSRKFEALIRSFSFKNTNYKWQEQMTEVQQKILNDCLRDTLKKYGYA